MNTENKRNREAGMQEGAGSTVLHHAARYDLLVWLLTFGRERDFRARVASAARIQPGESVLDVGCGTGTLAIVEKKLVGPRGKVCGIDASPEMIARARRKAAKAGLDIRFQNAAAASLPFEDAEFDVVTATMMLHHLPEDSLRQCLSEMRRVLKPGGRILLVDFGGGEGEKRGLIARVHRRIRFRLETIIPVLGDVGCRNVANGPLGFGGLQFILATHGGETGEALADAGEGTARPRRSPAIRTAAMLLVASPIALYAVLSHMSLPWSVALGLAFIVMLKHLGLLAALLGPGYAVFRRRAAARARAAAQETESA